MGGFTHSWGPPETSLRACRNVGWRLERGRFHPSFGADGRLSARAVEASELALILEGIDLAGARRRPRWEPRSAA